MNDAAFIRVEGIHKAVGAKEGLKGVRFEIRRGETMVVLGGSGSGKSVLLRHIIGLHKPDRGEVVVDGEDITAYDEDEMVHVRKKVAMLFQSGALFDSMTVAENVG